jgi:hypothetical protein
MDLLTTYTHHSELRVITAPSLISTIYKSPQYSLSFFPACCVFTCRFLATAYKSEESSGSRTQALLSQPPVSPLVNCRLPTQPPLQSSTELVAPVLFFITPRRGPRRKHCVSTVEYVTVDAGTYLSSRFPITVPIYSPIS